MMKRLLPVLLFVLIPFAGVPAQEAPAKADALLTSDEIQLWQSWIRGDIAGCYSQAQQMLEQPGYAGAEFRIALSLLTRCSVELGWHEALSRDLRALMEIHEGRYEQDLLRWELIECLKRLGKLDEIPKHRDALGLITNWWIAGPFPNDRGQGFEDVQEPETNLDLDAEYAGKDGQPIRWRKLPAQSLDGTIDIGAMLRPNREATAFLLTAIWADEADPDAEFTLASTDETRVSRLYGTQGADGLAAPAVALLNTSAERELGFDQEHTAFKRGAEIRIQEHEGLSAGWNVFLVKAGQSEGDWRFRVRLIAGAECRAADSNEQLAEALSGLPQVAPTYGGTGGDGTGYRTNYLKAAVELLCPRLDRSSTVTPRLLEDVLSGRYGGGNTNPWFGRKDAELVLRYLTAWANRSSVADAAGREENRRRELLKECLELDPSAARAALELSQYYTTTFGNPELADRYAQMAATLAPDWVEAQLYASRVVQMKGLELEVERRLAAMLQQLPGNAQVLRFAAYYAGLRRDFALSNELFAKALAADFTDSYSRERLIERAVQRGDLATAQQQADDARSLDPFNTAASAQLAELHINAERFADAEREAMRALSIAPRDDKLLELLGRIYSGWADSDAERAEALREQAVEAYRGALDANPNREDIERYLEFLEGEQPPFEALLQEEIGERIRRAQAEPIDGDNAYEVVFRERITLVNEDGTTATYTQEAYRVTNDNGRDWLRAIRVPAWSDQQGRCVEAAVWREDGWVEQGRRTRWHASFPPLEIGDVVHVRFRVTDREQSFFGDFFGAREVLADFVPIRELRLIWVLPRGKPVYEYRTLDAPAPQESEVLGRRVWTYEASNIPRLENEPLAPAQHQRAATVQLSTYRDWNDFGRWYYNLIRRQLEPTPEMIAKVSELTEGMSDEREKARAVYNWVVTAVRYNADWHFGVHGYKPFTAGAVFARGIGDCKDKAILICAMLEIAGVKAFPVIINLETIRGREDITLPMPHHFNHAIAYIEYSDGSGQFVDGTTTYHAFDELPAADAGAEVIIVRPDGGERATVPVPTAEEDRTTESAEAEFAPGGMLRLRVTRRSVGDSASSMRARFQREGDRRRQLENEWANHYAGARVSEIEVANISGLNGTPTLRYTVDLPGGWSVKNGGHEFKLAADARQWGQTSFASLTTRKTELVLPTPFSRVTTVTYKLPEGLKPETMEGLKIEQGNATLSVSFELSEDERTLTVTRSYEFHGGIISPEDYPKFREALTRFDNAEARTIRLTRE